MRAEQVPCHTLNSNLEQYNPALDILRTIMLRTRVAFAFANTSRAISWQTDALRARRIEAQLGAELESGKRGATVAGGDGNKYCAPIAFWGFVAASWADLKR